MQRAMIGTALAIAGGLISRGVARWSGPVIFPSVTLWVMCGVLLNQALTGLDTMGALVRQAGRQTDTERARLPYSRPRSPISLLSAELRSWRVAGHDSEARRTWGLALGAIILFALAAQLYAPQVVLILGVGAGVLATLTLARVPQGIRLALLTALAWAATSAFEQPPRWPQFALALVAGGSVATAVLPMSGRAARTWAMACSLSLGLAPALNWQPALACPIWTQGLAWLALPDHAQPSLAQRLLAAGSVFLAALSSSYWP